MTKNEIIKKGKQMLEKHNFEKVFVTKDGRVFSVEDHAIAHKQNIGGDVLPVTKDTKVDPEKPAEPAK